MVDEILRKLMYLCLAFTHFNKRFTPVFKTARYRFKLWTFKLWTS